MAEQQEQAERVTQSEEQSGTQAEDAGNSLRLAIVFSSIVLWVMSIFMITILYSINAKLNTMNEYLQHTMSLAARQPLDSFQVVDKDDSVIYRFRIDPALQQMPMEVMSGEMACPMTTCDSAAKPEAE